MFEATTFWASGDWQVSRGDEEEFVERWRNFLTWTKEANEGFVSARLIRDLNEVGHFVSVSCWTSRKATVEWQKKTEFAELFGACRGLCDDMRSGVFELAVAVDA